MSNRDDQASVATTPPPGTPRIKALKAVPDCKPCLERAQRILNRQATQQDPENLVPRYMRPAQTDALNEALLHDRRQGRPYSEGHRKMYDAVLELLSGQNLPPLDILEVGTGIGYGLDAMVKRRLVKNYLGLEPDPATYKHIQHLLMGGPSKFGRAGIGKGIPSVTYAAKHSYNTEIEEVRIINTDWPLRSDLSPAAYWPGGRDYDYSFCIEVIEHVRPDLVPAFLAELHQVTQRALFLSTPNALTSPHGVATVDEWRRVIDLAGFDVVAIERQWTTLYICQPRRNDHAN
jgi:hypothetical protein